MQSDVQCDVQCILSFNVDDGAMYALMSMNLIDLICTVGHRIYFFTDIVMFQHPHTWVLIAY